MKLTIKFIMGLIVATGLGLVPVQLDASSPTPLTQDEMVAAALNETFAPAQAAMPTVQAGQPEMAIAPIADPLPVVHAITEARYHVPARNTDAHTPSDLLCIKLLERMKLPVIYNEYSFENIFFKQVKYLLIIAAIPCLYNDYTSQKIVVSAIQSLTKYAMLCAGVSALAITSFIAISYYQNIATTFNQFIQKMIDQIKKNARDQQYVSIPEHDEILSHDCNICMEPLINPAISIADNNKVIIATNCSRTHLFHTACLNNWFIRRASTLQELRSGDFDADELAARIGEMGHVHSCPTCRQEVADPGHVIIVPSPMLETID